MIDRREEILARLLVIAGDTPSVVEAARNRDLVSGKDRPAVVIYDAAEENADFAGRPFRSRKEMMVLSPQIYLLLGAPSRIIGEKVSELRRLFIALVWNDDQLWSLVGSNGEVRFAGSGLDTTTGETREARLEVKFEFTYVMDLRELV